jgi:hypothetical protein
MIEIHYIVYPIFSIIAGALILLFPAILNYIVGIYLIVVGVLGLLGRVG